jgi:hypothetical protein
LLGVRLQLLDFKLGIKYEAGIENPEDCSKSFLATTLFAHHKNKTSFPFNIG